MLSKLQHTAGILLPLTRTVGTDDKPRLVLGLGSDKAAVQYKDKFLRDSTVSSVTVRNIGIE